MVSSRKSYACFIIALALLIALTVLAQPITSYSATETHKAVEPSVINEIVLEANKPDVSNSYNTNGTQQSLFEPIV